MLKSLDRYLLKEIAAPFGLGLMVYTFALLIHNVLILAETLVSRGATLGTILQIFSYMLPDLLSFTVPMSTLMGVLAGLSRMGADSEIIALRTMGVSNGRVLKPLMLFALLTWMMSSWLIMYLAPEANYRLNQLVTKIFFSQAVSQIKPGQFYLQFPQYVLYFRDTGPVPGEWRDVLLYSTRSAEDDTLVLARSARFLPSDDEEQGHLLVLENGLVHSHKKKDPQNYTQTRFGRKIEKLPTLLPLKQSRRSTQLVFPELLRRYRQEPADQSLATEFHRKFAQPFSCLVLALLGLALGLVYRKGGKTTGFILSLGFIFLYYLVATSGRNLVLKGSISPWLGEWLANFFLLAVALFFTRRAFRGERSSPGRRVVLRLLVRRPARSGVAFMRRLTARIPGLKIIDRYVMGRFAAIFSLVFFSLLMVFYIVTLVEMLSAIMENQVPFVYLLRYMYHFTPQMIGYALPVSVLMAVLLTFSLMSKNNEVIAVKVSGISLYRLALPSIILGLLFSFVFFWMQEKVIHKSNRLAFELRDVITKRRPQQTEFDMQRNWVLGRGGEIYFYDFFEKDRGRFENFNLIHLADDFSLLGRVQAGTAYWKDEKTLNLEDAFIREFADNLPRSFSTHRRTVLPLDEGPEFFRQKVLLADNLNIAELRAYLEYLRENRRRTERYQAQLYAKYAFPFSVLVMALIAVPFSFKMGRHGALYGIGIAVMVSMVFWTLVGLANALGASGALPPLLSALAPYLLFAFTSLFFTLSLKT